MKRVSVMISQPRYLPACNYIRRIGMSDIFVYLDNVQYTKRDFENRNKILTAQGPIWLSIPVIHRSREQKISETFIDYSVDWRKSHTSTIYHAYKKAPCFEKIYDGLEKHYIHKYEYLIEFNSCITSFFLQHLGITDTVILRASDVLKGGDENHSGQSLLVEICRAVGGTRYISGPNGREYIDETFFKDSGIELFYHDYKCLPYAQANYKGDFQPYMSILDLLMNYEKEKALEILNV